MRRIESGIDAAHRAGRQNVRGHLRVLERKQRAGFIGPAGAASGENHTDLAGVAGEQILAAWTKIGAENSALVSQLPLELRIIHSPSLGGCGGSIIPGCGAGNRRMAARRLRMTEASHDRMRKLSDYPISQNESGEAGLRRRAARWHCL